MTRGFSSTSDVLTGASQLPENDVHRLVKQIGGLTDAMVAELSAHFQIDNLADTVAEARAGGGAAYRRLVELSIPVDIRSFETSWAGSIAAFEIREALRQELAALKTIKTPQPSEGRSTPTFDRQKGANDPLPPPAIPNVAFETPTWRSLAAKAKFPLQQLDRTEREILELIDRVLVRGEGWGPKDPERGRHRTIRLQPSRLAQHGAMRSSRTYQRAIVQLVKLKLIRVDSYNSDHTREFVPTWWEQSNQEAAVRVWVLARMLAQPPTSVSHRCRTNVASLADPCRTGDAPPVRAHRPATYFTCTRLGPVGVRHLAGRLTSDFLQLTTDTGCPRAVELRARSAPCLPDGQARRAGGVVRERQRR